MKKKKSDFDVSFSLASISIIDIDLNLSSIRRKCNREHEDTRKLDRVETVWLRQNDIKVRQWYSVLLRRVGASRSFTTGI